MSGELVVLWNGSWGAKRNRKIYVRPAADGRGFEVEARQGDDAPRIWHLPTEGLVAWLIADLTAPVPGAGPVEWRDLTRLY